VIQRSLATWLAVWVFVCLKCGLLQWQPHPCTICHRVTVKQWLDDAYLDD